MNELSSIHSHTVLQHTEITPKPIFGLGVAGADRVQREISMRGLSAPGGHEKILL